MERDESQELLEQFKQRLEEERPAQWDNLPDIPLYMDQVVSYLGRQLITFGGGDALTSAMINNYIKDGLVPRANGKKYAREHLAYLTIVAAVKQVLSVRDMGVLLQSANKPIDPQALYTIFQHDLDLALKGTLADIETFPNQEDLSALALSLAVQGYASALACRRIVDLLRPEEEKKKKHKEEKNTV